jgi:hypothetical protein
MNEKEINEAMDQVLANCDGTAYPRICQKTMTESGRAYVKNRMIHLITKDGMPTLSACLPHIENELDGL